ncbi:SDR family oxidoreductase [Azotobacter armeniacus]
MGAVDDVTRAAAWLAHDEADYITGTTLYVDGDMMLYPAFPGKG